MTNLDYITASSQKNPTEIGDGLVETEKYDPKLLLLPLDGQPRIHRAGCKEV